MRCVLVRGNLNCVLTFTLIAARSSYFRKHFFDSDPKIELRTVLFSLSLICWKSHQMCTSKTSMTLINDGNDNTNSMVAHRKTTRRAESKSCMWLESRRFIISYFCFITSFSGRETKRRSKEKFTRKAIKNYCYWETRRECTSLPLRQQPEASAYWDSIKTRRGIEVEREFGKRWMGRGKAKSKEADEKRLHVLLPSSSLHLICL